MLPHGTDKELKNFPPKEKLRLIIISQVINNFNKDNIYNEKKVNQIISKSYQDHTLIRRYLIEYDFLDRKPDGSQYWVK
ncbi:MAG: DUF2087 domain-containing protein [Actinomycetota bacterium]|nr:DUF2087 domain-containing protein [Actinomycetota bacterium]